MNFPILSGVCGSIASYSGKIAFQDEQQLIIRIIGLIVMLMFNKWMLQFNFKSLQLNGSSITVLLQFIVGNLINALNGYLLLDEQLNIKWLIGIILMCIGVYLISKDNKSDQKQE